MDPQTKAVVEFEQGTLSIDAAVVGRGLNVEPSLVPVQMHEGKITVLCERGLNEDAGRYRLNFFYENRRFLVVDEAAMPSNDNRFWRPPTSRCNAQTLGMTGGTPGPKLYVSAENPSDFSDIQNTGGGKRRYPLSVTNGY